MPQYYTGNYRLTSEEMHVNALYIAGLLRNEGWTYEAIAGLFGNAQSESRINPGAWQDYTETNVNADDKGYGLVQWTPARDYIAWCNSRGLSKGEPSTAVKRFMYEAENGLQYYKTSRYPEPSTFYNFMRSSLDPNYLGRAFLYNYERPAEPDAVTRGRQADYWYTYITGNPAPKPPPSTWKKGKWYMFMRKKQTVL